MPDYSWADRDDWQSAWDPLVAVIGTDLRPEPIYAIDPIEQSLVRQYNEPIEFDCPLFYDEDVARAHGYPGIIAPYSGFATWTSVGIWAYGDDPLYISADRNEMPRFKGIRENQLMTLPDTNGAMATDVEYEYLRPFLVGDSLHVRGRKLLSAVPKQTSVGRGVFTVWESTAHNQEGAHIATQRLGLYRYVTGTFS